jgi:hypothetical protein
MRTEPMSAAADGRMLQPIVWSLRDPTPGLLLGLMGMASRVADVRAKPVSATPGSAGLLLSERGLSAHARGRLYSAGRLALGLDELLSESMLRCAVRPQRQRRDRRPYE